MSETGLRVAADVKAEVGESPFWDAPARVLRFVDSLAGVVYRYDPADGSLSSFDAGQVVGAVVPRAGGGLVAAVEDGVAYLDEETGSLELFAPIDPDDRESRLNDAKCDPAGRLWTGTLRYDLAPGASALYRVLPGDSVTRVAGGVSISNGLGWSPDGDRMYYADTGAATVDVFDFDVATGEAANRRSLARFTPEGGLPDGLAVDAEGHVWVALFQGSRVERYSPDGDLVGAIELPVTEPTSVAFGGDDLGDLYITTARIYLTDDDLAAQPHAGATFVCRPGVTGAPVAPFAG